MFSPETTSLHQLEKAYQEKGNYIKYNIIPHIAQGYSISAGQTAKLVELEKNCRVFYDAKKVKKEIAEYNRIADAALSDIRLAETVEDWAMAVIKKPLAKVVGGTLIKAFA